MAGTADYTQTFSQTVEGYKIKYGVLFGNEKIVFIKVGTDGTIRGYQDKYPRMARRIHERTGATVICSSNPDISAERKLEADKAFIEKIIAEQDYENCEFYFVGTSDGAEHSLKLALQFPKTVKFLGISSSWSVEAEFLKMVKDLSCEKKIFAYGTDDEDFDVIVPRLKALDCDNLELIIFDGVDHFFTGKVDDFIALIDVI